MSLNIYHLIIECVKYNIPNSKGIEKSFSSASVMGTFLAGKEKGKIRKQLLIV